MKRRALITGISGQTGSYLAELLVEQGYEVWGLVRGSAEARYANLEQVRDQVRLVQGDLLDPPTVTDAVAASRPAEVYNLAAASSVQESWSRPLVTSQLNGPAVTALLEAVRAADAGIRVYQASSSEVFGWATESPQSERTPFHPRSPYGAAKAYAHFVAGAYRERYAMHVCCGISYNHESPRRAPAFVSRKVTQAAAAIKLGLQEEVVLGDLAATRDWSHARDQARAMWLMVQQQSPDDYVICSGTGRSVRQLVESAFAAAGLDWEQHVRTDPAFVRPAEPVPLVGDPAKAETQLGWQREASFDEMIRSMVEHDIELLRAQRS